jgi:hypothetical protein
VLADSGTVGLVVRGIRRGRELCAGRCCWSAGSGHRSPRPPSAQVTSLVSVNVRLNNEGRDSVRGAYPKIAQRIRRRQWRDPATSVCGHKPSGHCRRLTCAASGAIDLSDIHTRNEARRYHNGIGALVARRELRLAPLLHTGRRSGARPFRSGTLNVSGCARAFAAAVEARLRRHTECRKESGGYGELRAKL